MALVVDGVPVGGSIGKTTYSRNRYGAYTRRRTKPVNPDSTLQQLSRSAFAAAVNYWTDVLTPLERAAWQTYAADVTWLNAAGETVHLTGQAMFIRWYSYYVYWTSNPPAVLTPPGTFDIGSIVPTEDSCELTYDISANELTFAGTFVLLLNPWNVEDSILSVRVCQPTNSSRNFRPNRAAKLGIATLPEVASPSITVGPFPSPWVYQADQAAWAYLRVLSVDRQLSSEILVRCNLTVQA